MKSALNSAMKGKKINEINLFREMAKLFNGSRSKCTYVEEVHGRRGIIEFSSCFLPGNKKVEISDLLLLTFDKNTEQLRICFLQAKYRQGKVNEIFNFNANIFQWELLLTKPDIISTNFPRQILNFRNDYASITAYGILYHDDNDRIDFLYTIPRCIRPSRKIITPIEKHKSIRAFRLKEKCIMPNCFYTGCIRRNETISTGTLDMFESQVLNCRIGAPIIFNPHITSYIINLLNVMKRRASEPFVIDELLEYIQKNYENSNEEVTIKYSPAALIVITDSSEIE